MSESSYSLEEQSNSSIKRPYRRVTPEKKQELLREVFENKLKITRAARKVELNVSTAKFLVKQYKKAHPEWAGLKKAVKPVSASPSSSATEEENQTQQTPQQASFLPYYFPFYPGTPYPWVAQSSPFLPIYYSQN